MVNGISERRWMACASCFRNEPASGGSHELKLRSTEDKEGAMRVSAALSKPSKSIRQSLSSGIVSYSRRTPGVIPLRSDHLALRSSSSVCHVIPQRHDGKNDFFFIFRKNLSLYIVAYWTRFVDSSVKKRKTSPFISRSVN